VNASSSEAAPLEIEAKVRVLDRGAFERALAALGALPGPTEHETNTLLDDPGMSLTARGEALRVRETAGRGLVTFKGKASVSRGVKTRTELESGVQSPATLRRIFAALGYTPRFFYEKRRTVWRFEAPGRPLVTLDETPIGLFAEIEGTDEGVRALAAELGLAETDLLHDSYVALYRAAREADPSLPPDMRFARDAGARPGEPPAHRP